MPSRQPEVAAATSRDHPVRVLLTTPVTSKPGGVAQYLRVLRPHLPEDVQYFTIGSRHEGERIGTSVLRAICDSWKFARTLWRSNYDIVHLNPSIGFKALLREGLLLVVAKSFQKKVVVFAHGWDDGCVRVLSTYLSGLFRLVYRRADAFIVLGSEFKNRLRRLGYDGSVFIHGAPIEGELIEYCEQQPECGAGRRKDEKFNILFLARVEREKGIFEALEAYQIVKSQCPFVSLTVAGSGSKLDDAVQYARTRQLADVSFLGAVEGPVKYAALTAAHAYLFPSHGEGLPLSVLEAMACGLPIVTRAVGGLRDFFQDGWMGFMTESRDPRVLASLMSRLICDPSLISHIRTFNYTYAREHFAAPRVAVELEGVYHFVHRRAD